MCQLLYDWKNLLKRVISIGTSFCSMHVQFFQFCSKLKKKLTPRLSERLELLGIMETQLRALLKLLDTIVLWCSRGFRLALKLVAHDAERRQSLGQLYIQRTRFLNLVKLNQIWIVITFFLLAWHQMKFRLLLNKSEKCDYNQIWFNLTNIRSL